MKTRAALGILAAAGLAATAHLPAHNDAVSSVEERVGTIFDVLKGTQPFTPGAPYTVITEVSAAFFNWATVVHPHDGRVIKCEDGLHITPFPRVPNAPHDFNVIPRH